MPLGTAPRKLSRKARLNLKKVLLALMILKFSARPGHQASKLEPNCPIPKLSGLETSKLLTKHSRVPNSRKFSKVLPTNTKLDVLNS